MPLMPTPRDIGNIIRAERRTQGLSQQELADRAGVSRKWISEIENTKRTAEIGSILRVLRALGRTIQLAPIPEPTVDLQAHIQRFVRSETP